VPVPTASPAGCLTWVARDETTGRAPGRPTRRTLRSVPCDGSVCPSVRLSASSAP